MSGFRAIPIPAVALMLACGGSAVAATYLVRPDGTGDYPTIQAAIFACENEDVVELADGTYTGPGNVDVTNGEILVIVRAQSGDAAACVIDCQGSSADPHHFIQLATGGERSHQVWGLYNLTITGGHAYSGGAVQVIDHAWPEIHGCVFRANAAEHVGGAIYVCGGNPRLAGCVFAGNLAAQGAALGAIGESAVDVSGCTFLDNQADAGGAIFVELDNGSAISSSTFVRNRAPLGAALCLEAHHYAIPVEHCLVAFNLEGVGVHVVDDRVDLACCDLFANGGGDWVGPLADQLGQAGNLALDPFFCDLAQDDLRLGENSPCAPGVTCGLIGAWPVGCGPIGVEAATWSDVKAAYRSEGPQKP